MKYTIEGFNQEKAVEFGLDIEDLMILRWFVDFSPKMSQKQIEEETYYWVNYKSILEDMPILSFKTKDRVYRKMKKMVEKNILKHSTFKNEDGTYSYYTFSDNYEILIGVGKNTEGGSVKITEHNNSSIIKNNNICSLSEDFEKLWSIYPRKDGKASAFKHYKSWINGKEYAGKKEKLENREMWYAIKIYDYFLKENKTEAQYIKMGSTFFNESIFEYANKYRTSPDYWKEKIK